MQVVVLIGTPLTEALRIDDFCHANGVALIRVRLARAPQIPTCLRHSALWWSTPPPSPPTIPTSLAAQADIRGVFASVFCDFGPAFEVLDVDGEEPHTGIIAGVTPGSPTLITTVEDERLEFQDGEAREALTAADSISEV